MRFTGFMGFVRRWVALLDERQAATSLAVCRIIVGVSIFRQLVETWTSGAANAMWIDLSYGGAQSLRTEAWLALVGGYSPRNVFVLLLVGTVGAAALAVGTATRVAAFFAWFGFRTLTVSNGDSGGSSDDLLVNIVFILIFSGAGNALSIDAWRRPSAAAVPAWPRYALIAQLVLMYTTTGLQKISASWVPGGPADALWYILQQPTWQRRPMTWVAPAYPLTQVATWVVWLFETGAPVLLLALWYRRTRDRPGRVRALCNRWDLRRACLALGLLLHVGIVATLEVGPFLGGVLALYACVLDPAEWQRFLARSAERVRRVARRWGALAPQRSND